MSRKTPDIEQHVVWNGDGSYAPTCDVCNWRGKDRPNHTDTRAAVLAHRRTKRHRDNQHEHADSK